VDQQQAYPVPIVYLIPQHLMAAVVVVAALFLLQAALVALVEVQIT
jgi:hypothetical protein